MSSIYHKLKEKLISALGVALYFILIFINEVLFEIEYLFKRPKKSSKTYSPKIFELHKTVNPKLPTPISIHQENLQWFKKNKKYF